jgi:hypothetical protein
MENIKDITLYISIWNWQILAMLFLCSGMICLGLPRNNISFIFFIVFIILFASCEFVSNLRRRQFYNGSNYETS